MNRDLKLNDKMKHRDEICHGIAPMRVEKQSPFARTQVKIFDEFGDCLFTGENQVVLGGALFVLQKCWGVESKLKVKDLNTIYNISNTGAPVDPLSKDNLVCLFGVGIGGAGDAPTSVKDVKFHEREIMDMVPLRITDQELSIEDQNKYWFRKKDDLTTAYFLKTFESEPEIKTLWKDGPEDEDGTPVEGDVHDTVRTEPIETFVEMILKISKKDVREFFQLNGNIEQTRVNSIGLFTGVKGQLADGTQDYKNVTLFSKLNIPNEILVLSKDLTIQYRVFTS